MAKLEIDFIEATSTRYEQIHFKQAGLVGLKLRGCWLPEFLVALEQTDNTEPSCMFQDYWVLRNKAGAVVRKTSIASPLLSLDAGQCDRLVAHLKSTYPHLL